MDTRYYICLYLLDKKHRYLIWCSNDEDTIFTENGKVPIFKTKDHVLSYAVAHNIKIESEEPKLHDLDVVDNWLRNPNAEHVDCSQFIAAWNLFGDISTAVAGQFDTNRKLTQKVYDKMFWGNNLPSVTPRGKKYEPVWTDAEVQLLKKTLAHGLDLFRASITEKV